MQYVASSNLDTDTKLTDTKENMIRTDKMNDTKLMNLNRT